MYIQQSQSEKLKLKLIEEIYQKITLILENDNQNIQFITFNYVFNKKTIKGEFNTIQLNNNNIRFLSPLGYIKDETDIKLTKNSFIRLNLSLLELQYIKINLNLKYPPLVINHATLSFVKK
jgi:hypothetical protein